MGWVKLLRSDQWWHIPMFGQDRPSKLQDQILTVYDRNPDMSPRQIAERCDCSTSYVRETINEYRSTGIF